MGEGWGRGAPRTSQEKLGPGRGCWGAWGTVKLIQTFESKRRKGQKPKPESGTRPCPPLCPSVLSSSHSQPLPREHGGRGRRVHKRNPTPHPKPVSKMGPPKQKAPGKPFGLRPPHFQGALWAPLRPPVPWAALLLSERQVCASLLAAAQGAGTGEGGGSGAARRLRTACTARGRGPPPRPTCRRSWETRLSRRLWCRPRARASAVDRKACEPPSRTGRTCGVGGWRPGGQAGVHRRSQQARQ